MMTDVNFFMTSTADKFEDYSIYALIDRFINKKPIC